jgi:hypothetical protein
LNEEVWRGDPLATIDTTGLTFGAFGGVRRICFADVVRFERRRRLLCFTTADGSAWVVNLHQVSEADWAKAFEHLERLIPAFTARVGFKHEPLRRQLPELAWICLLVLASFQLVDLSTRWGPKAWRIGSSAPVRIAEPGQIPGVRLSQYGPFARGYAAPAPPEVDLPLWHEGPYRGPWQWSNCGFWALGWACNARL